MSKVRKDRTDCEGRVWVCVFMAPPPYWNVAALITAIAPLWMPTLPQEPGARLDELVSPVTLIGVGTRVVVAVSSWIDVKSTCGSLALSATKPGVPGPYLLPGVVS